MFVSGSFTRARTPAVLWSKTATTPLPDLVLDQVKTFVNRPLEDAFWDAETRALTKVAISAIEQHCSLTLGLATWVGTSWDFPTIIRQRPFRSVDKVEYVDPSTGVVTTIDPLTYVVAPYNQFTGQLLNTDQNDWPEIATRPDAVRVTVQTGFGSPLPDDIMHALMMTVAALDLNRGDIQASSGHLTQTVYGQTHSSAPSVIPSPALALLGPYIYRGVYTS